MNSSRQLLNEVDWTLNSSDSIEEDICSDYDDFEYVASNEANEVELLSTDTEEIQDLSFPIEEFNASQEQDEPLDICSAHVRKSYLRMRNAHK